MRVLVFSDSHGSTKGIDKAISAIGRFDAIIHLGDVDRDVRYIEKKYSQYPIYAVRGNNEFGCSDYGSTRQTEMVLELEGTKIYMCHGHLKRVRSGTEGMVSTAKDLGCTVALYGHTHVPHDEVEDGILVFNPGSCTQPRQGVPTFGVLEIENGKCSSVVVDWVL